MLEHWQALSNEGRYRVKIWGTDPDHLVMIWDRELNSYNTTDGGSAKNELSGSLADAKVWAEGRIRELGSDLEGAEWEPLHEKIPNVG